MRIKATQLSGYSETIDTRDLWTAPSLIWQVYVSQPDNSPQAQTLAKVHSLLCAINNGTIELKPDHEYTFEAGQHGYQVYYNDIEIASSYNLSPIDKELNIDSAKRLIAKLEAKRTILKQYIDSKQHFMLVQFPFNNRKVTAFIVMEFDKRGDKIAEKLFEFENIKQGLKGYTKFLEKYEYSQDIDYSLLHV